MFGYGMIKSNSNYKQVNEELIEKLNDRIYWKPTLNILKIKLEEIKKEKQITEKKALITVLDDLKEVMYDSSKDVANIINKRYKQGKIDDKGQVNVAVAGNNFQALIAYILVKNVLIGNLPPLIITLKPKKDPLLEKYAVIKTGDEIQKPDVDIMVHSPKDNTPIIVFSCKTSLRERAGQTYKWKLLIDFATTECKYVNKSKECPINKYGLKYDRKRKVLVGFITADFYDEINNPQQQGILQFFDFCYVANKEKITSKYVKRLSEIVGDLKGIYNLNNKS